MTSWLTFWYLLCILVIRFSLLRKKIVINQFKYRKVLCWLTVFTSANDPPAHCFWPVVRQYIMMRAHWRRSSSPHGGKKEKKKRKQLGIPISPISTKLHSTSPHTFQHHHSLAMKLLPERPLGNTYPNHLYCSL